VWLRKTKRTRRMRSRKKNKAKERWWKQTLSSQLAPDAASQGTSRTTPTTARGELYCVRSHRHAVRETRVRPYHRITSADVHMNVFTFSERQQCAKSCMCHLLIRGGWPMVPARSPKNKVSRKGVGRKKKIKKSKKRAALGSGSGSRHAASSAASLRFSLSCFPSPPLSHQHLSTTPLRSRCV
jgi:hypothetical protein